MTEKLTQPDELGQVYNDLIRDQISWLGEWTSSSPFDHNNVLLLARQHPLDYTQDHQQERLTHAQSYGSQREKQRASQEMIKQVNELARDQVVLAKTFEALSFGHYDKQVHGRAIDTLATGWDDNRRQYVDNHANKAWQKLPEAAASGRNVAGLTHIIEKTQDERHRTLMQRGILKAAQAMDDVDYNRKSGLRAAVAAINEVSEIADKFQQSDDDYTLRDSFANALIMRIDACREVDPQRSEQYTSIINALGGRVVSKQEQARHAAAQSQQSNAEQLPSQPARSRRERRKQAAAPPPIHTVTAESSSKVIWRRTTQVAAGAAAFAALGGPIAAAAAPLLSANSPNNPQTRLTASYTSPANADALAKTATLGSSIKLPASLRTSGAVTLPQVLKASTIEATPANVSPTVQPETVVIDGHQAGTVANAANSPASSANSIPNSPTNSPSEQLVNVGNTGPASSTSPHIKLPSVLTGGQAQTSPSISYPETVTIGSTAVQTPGNKPPETVVIGGLPAASSVPGARTANNTPGAFNHNLISVNTPPQTITIEGSADPGAIAQPIMGSDPSIQQHKAAFQFDLQYGTPDQAASDQLAIAQAQGNTQLAPDSDLSKAITDFANVRLTQPLTIPAEATTSTSSDASSLVANNTPSQSTTANAETAMALEILRNPSADDPVAVSNLIGTPDATATLYATNTLPNMFGEKDGANNYTDQELWDIYHLLGSSASNSMDSSDQATFLASIPKPEVATVAATAPDTTPAGVAPPPHQTVPAKPAIKPPAHPAERPATAHNQPKAPERLSTAQLHIKAAEKITNSTRSMLFVRALESGFNPQAASAAIGNLDVESAGLESRRTQFSAGVPGNVLDYIPDWFADKYGYGFGQWTSADRQQGLRDFAKARGTGVGDPETQWLFIMHEIKRDYPGLISKMNNASSVNEATKIFMEKYERPGDPNLPERQRRGNSTFQSFNSHLASETKSYQSTQKRYTQQLSTFRKNQQKQEAAQSKVSHVNAAQSKLTSIAKSVTKANNYNHVMNSLENSIPGYNPAGLNGGKDCALSVGSIVRYANIDQHFPYAGTVAQYDHMTNSVHWQRVKNIGSTSNLKPGDIFSIGRDHGQGAGGHTFMYVGKGKIVSASMGDHGPEYEQVYFTDSRNGGGNNNIDIFRYTA